MSEAEPRPGALDFLLPTSVRAKFVSVVGGVLVMVFAASGLYVYSSVGRLGDDASDAAKEGIHTVSNEYLTKYTESMATRQDAVLDNLINQLNVASGLMQTLIDHPEMADRIGQALESDPSFESPMVYDETGQWAQNPPGNRSVVSVWGYLLDARHKPLPAVAREVRNSSALDLIGPSIVPETRKNFQQIYYVGPQDQAIMRTVPWVKQAQNFDAEYKGHNAGEPKFWQFFFPGIYESWQEQISANPGIGDVITGTVPYVDAITKEQIVTFFHPLWDKQRAQPQGAVAIDIRLDQLTGMIPDVKVATTGFAFLATADGDVIAMAPSHLQLMGLTEKRVDLGGGVILIQKLLSQSTDAGVKALKISKDATSSQVTIADGASAGPGAKSQYVLTTQPLKQLSIWTPQGAEPLRPKPERWVLGLVVPLAETDAPVHKAREDIETETRQSLRDQATIFLAGTIIALLAVVAVARRVTGPLSELAEAAERIRHKDYSVRVNIPTRDEVGTLARVFNEMTEEIQAYTENLERKVEERTQKLEMAKSEITALNERLKAENVRLGAEVDVVQRLQKMILPKEDELSRAPDLDISGFMQPADEVGGDYYDVLQAGNVIKVGMGDVTGHGLESGVVMLMVQSVALTLFHAGDYSPERFLAVLNEVIYKNVNRIQTDRSLSLLFVDFSPGFATISGQHEHVIVMRQSGELTAIDTMDLGYTVGLLDDIQADLRTLTVPFEPGDTLVLFSDGITEAESETPHQLYGLEQLCESVRRGHGRTAAEINEAIIADVTQFIGRQKVHDDITLLVIRHK